jgi:uncharacterized protein (DUF1919 family)
MNKFALAKACIKTCIKQIDAVPIDNATNISPNCLKVDKATTFFPSFSKRAETLATIKVIAPI